MLKPPAPTISALNWNFVALWEMESCRCTQCSDQRPIQWSCPRRDQRGRALPALPSPSNQLSMPERTQWPVPLQPISAAPWEYKVNQSQGVKGRDGLRNLWTWYDLMYYIVLRHCRGQIEKVDGPVLLWVLCSLLLDAMLSEWWFSWLWAKSRATRRWWVDEWPCVCWQHQCIAPPGLAKLVSMCLEDGLPDDSSCILTQQITLKSACNFSIAQCTTIHWYSMIQ